MVYDGAATVNGVYLNQLVVAGENLSNGLVEVLTRFRMGKYACVTDLSIDAFFRLKSPPISGIYFAWCGLEIMILITLILRFIALPAMFGG